MYVDPFWAGFVLGALAMAGLLVTLSVLYGKRRG